MGALCEQQGGAGVPEVMEANVRQSGPPQKRLEGAVTEVRWVDEGAVLRGEDEAAGLVEGTHPFHLRYLSLKVASQGVCGDGGESDATAALGGLEITQNCFATLSDKGVSQAEQAALKVHVLPLEAQKLTFPHASVYSQHVEGFETIAARRFEQGLCLLPIQGGNLFALDLRGFDGIADVAGDQPVEHRLFERLAKYAVHLVHRGRRKAGVKLLTVESPHMGGIEVFELETPQGRN